MKSVLISTSSFGVESQEPLNRLREAGISVELNPYGRKLNHEETVKLLQDKAGVLAGTEAYPKEVLAQLPNLKIISRCGAGTDGIDQAYLKEHGITLCSTPNVHITAVAELTLAGLLSITRKMPQHHATTVAGQWGKVMGSNLAGKTVGLIGFGKVGQAVAKLLHAFGCQIIAFDPYLTGNSETVMRASTVHDIWTQADVISLHAPSTQETKGIINGQALSAMKPNVIILNTSRGDLVDEQALFDFLQSNPQASAYLDVFQQEPYQGPLSKLPNVVVTPHVGTFTKETRVNMELEAATHLIQYFLNNG